MLLYGIPGFPPSAFGTFPRERVKGTNSERMSVVLLVYTINRNKFKSAAMDGRFLIQLPAKPATPKFLKGSTVRGHGRPQN